MRNDKKEETEEEKIKEPVELKGKDVKSKFEYWCDFIPTNPFELYVAKYKSIEHGKELLPFDLEDPVKQKEIKALHEKAKLILKTAIPKERKKEYSYFDEGGKRHLCMKITSKDIGKSTTPEAEYKKTLDDFILDQYQQHMSELQEIFDEIYHQLVIHKVIKIEDKSPKEVIKDLIKNRFKDKFETKEEKK